MEDKINTFLLKNPFELVPMDRKAFYEEQVLLNKNGGKPDRAIEVVNIMMFNSYGEMIIQKRSFDKNHNPGLLDKSIGGHVQFGDTPDYTAMVETIQELQTPSIVLKNENDFIKTFHLLNKYLETISVIRYFTTTLYIPIKIINKEEVPIANKMHLYLGIYDGRIRPVDRESKGVLFYSLSELRNEMEKSPDTFTNDMHTIMKEYKEDIEKFVEMITKK